MQASSVTVKVGWCDKRLRVEVTDDGVGGAMPRPGSGLQGLADRVAALDGQLMVDSHPGTGTGVTAEIPCADHRDDAALVRQGVARLLADAGFQIVAQLPDAVDPAPIGWRPPT